MTDEIEYEHMGRDKHLARQLFLSIFPEVVRQRGPANDPEDALLFAGYALELTASAMHILNENELLDGEVPKP